MGRPRRRVGVGALGLATLLVLPGLVAAGSVAAQPPVWIVSDANSQIILFGSVHVLPASLDNKSPDWMPNTVKSALIKAQDVWFELPMDTATTAQVSQLALAKGLLPEGGSLSDQISEAAKERLGRISLRLGFRPDQLDRFQPWLAEASLAVAAFQMEGASGKDGVEQILSRQLGPKVKREAFETPEQQIGFLAGASQEDQLASLEETLRQIDEEPQAYRTLVAAWMAADLATLDAEALQPVRQSTPALYQALIKGRNTRWVQSIRKRLAGRGTTLVVVGVGHLVGPDGVPAQLRALGIAVDGP